MNRLSRHLVRPARALVPIAALLLTSAPGGSAAAAPVVLRDVQTSIYTATPPGTCPQGFSSPTCIQPDTEVEPSIAVNPTNPLNVITVFQAGRIDGVGGDADNGFASSFDGGATWTSGLLPGLTVNSPRPGPYDRASDAVVAFGPDGTAYANSLVFDAVTPPCPPVDPLSLGCLQSGIYNQVSRDGGRTWSDPVLVTGDAVGGTIDKNWIVVDQSNAPGHHLGRIYCTWDRIAPVLAAYSDDQGQTWHNGTGAGYVVYGGQGIGTIPLILNDGSLAVVFTTDAYVAPSLYPGASDQLAEPVTGVTREVVALSPAAGSLPTGAPLAFTPPVSVGFNASNLVRGQRAGEVVSSAAVDPVSGRIYVAWDDARFRTAPGNLDVNDIVMTTSDDNGVHWSSVRRVNAGPTDDEVNHWCPMLAVGNDGTLHLAYRQRQENAGGDPNTFAPAVGTYFYQESHDGGTTFGTAVGVGAVANNDVRYAASSRAGSFLGDYNQLAVGGNLTYIARAEALQLDPSEKPTVPPIYHHQRIFVAVVQS